MMPVGLRPDRAHNLTLSLLVLADSRSSGPTSNDTEDGRGHRSGDSRSSYLVAQELSSGDCHDRELKLGGSSGGGPLPRMR